MSIRVNGLYSGLDTEGMVKDLVSAYDKKTTTYQQQQEQLKWKQEKWKDLNKDIYGFYSNTLSNLRFDSGYGSDTSLKVSSNGVSATGKLNGGGVQTIDVQQLAKGSFFTGTEVDNATKLGRRTSLTFKDSTGAATEINLEEGMGMKEVAKSIEEATNLKATFDETNHRFMFNSKEAGIASNFSFESSDPNILSTLGMAAGIYSHGQDGRISFNGAEFTSTDNSYQINDLSLNVFNVGVVTVAEERQNSVHESIEKFLEEYNKIMKSIEGAYNASSSKGYMPLTEEEKSALTDKQIEEWEEKGKEGLLRKDPTLASLSNLLRAASTKAYKLSDGKYYSLASFGIASDNYFSATAAERSSLKIQDKNKLEKADPEKLQELMKAIAGEEYDALGKKMKSTSMRSAYTVYDDKALDKNIKGFDEKIKKWKDKVAAIEERYYKQFAAMEKVLASIQNNGSSLTNLFK